MKEVLYTTVKNGNSQGQKTRRYCGERSKWAEQGAVNVGFEK